MTCLRDAKHEGRVALRPHPYLAPLCDECWQGEQQVIRWRRDEK